MKKQKFLLKYRYCLGLFLVLGIFLLSAAGMQAQEEKYAYVTIERSTIGEGFILKPTRVLISNGDTYADVFVKACEQNGIVYSSSGNISNGSYHLSGIYNGDNGFVKIPTCIRNLPDCPLGESPLNKYAPELREGSFLESSGWTFSVNGTFSDKEMADHEKLPQNGDVLRVQYTVYGDGADIGRSGNGGVALQLANKTALIRLVGEVHANETKWFAVSGCKDAYENAVQVLAQLDSTAASVDKAMSDLKKFENVVSQESDEKSENGTHKEEEQIKSCLSKKKLTSIMKKIRKYMLSQDTIPDHGSEWALFGMKRSSLSIPDSYKKTYYQNILKEMAEQKGVLSKKKYTEYSELILAVTSIGKDARYVGGYNLLKPLSNYGNVKKQGLYGAEMALLAVDSNSAYKFSKPESGTQTTKKKLINYILKKQIKNGGFSANGKAGNIRLTAIAIQALAPYCDTRKDVKGAVDRALIYLSKKQRADGRFSSGGVVSSELSSQVVIALTAAGIDPATDMRFVKNGKSVLEGLLVFYVKDRGFSHTKGSGYNEVSTERGYEALAAYERFLREKTSLYDMSDIKVKKDTTKVTLKKKSSSSNGTGSSRSGSGNRGTRVIFKPGINFNGTGASGSSITAEKSTSDEKKKAVSESLIMTKKQLFKIANKDKSLSVKGKTKSGKIYRFTINGADLTQVLEFNGTVTEDDTYQDDMALLAEVLQCFRIEQKEFPGEMTLEIDTDNAEGTYGLFAYEPVYQSAEYVEEVKAENGKFCFTVKQGGLYYIAKESKLSVSDENTVKGAEIQSSEEEEIENETLLEEDAEDKKVEHLLAVVVLVCLLALEFYEKRKSRN